MRGSSLLRVLAALSSGLIAAGAAHAQVTLPHEPLAGEPFMVAHVFCAGSSPNTLVRAETIVSGSNIRVDAEFDIGPFSVGQCTRLNSYVPGLAAGDYSVSFRPSAGDAYIGLGTVGIRPSTGSVQPLHRRISGNWFDPLQPGWGVNIVQGASGALFAAWMTYEYDFRSEDTRTMPGIWVVMPEGRWTTPTSFRGLFFRTAASPVNAPFDASRARVLPSGLGTFEFVSADEMRFDGVLVINGAPVVLVAKTLRRLGF